MALNFESVNPDEVDALLTAELNEMTFDERETVYEEIHGVEPEIQETEELLEGSLMQMEMALQRLPRQHSRECYEKALQINPRYVEDRAFRLMFLRCEYFDPEKAAKRLALFLQGKARFFGEGALARPITLDDMDEDDMAFLKSGILQIIPSRDRSGRLIMADFNMHPSMPQPKTADNLVRLMLLLS